MKIFRNKKSSQKGATLVEGVVALNIAVLCIFAITIHLQGKVKKHFRTTAYVMNFDNACDYLNSGSEPGSEQFCLGRGGGSEEGAN